jgi:uncharacterized protein (TIGR02996 family)
MTPRQKALLAAIAAAPQDDGPRLAYADWAEANGDPARAEFIRVQCEVARRWDGHRYRKNAAWNEGRDDLGPLLERENTLFLEHGARWLAELPEPLRKECNFHRGFPDKIEITRADLLAHGGEWLRLLPGPEVHVREIGQRRPQPPLDVKQMLTPAGMKAFTERQTFHGVGEGVRALAGFPGPAGLRRLDLSRNELTGSQLAELLRSPHFPEAESLDLGSNKVGPTGAQAAAASPRLSRLRSLGFWFGEIAPAGRKASADSPHLAELRSLQLYANRIGDAGARALAESPYLEHLEHLILTSTPLTIEGWRVLKERFGARFVFGFYRTEADWAARPNPVEDEDEDKDEE